MCAVQDFGPSAFSGTRYQILALCVDPDAAQEWWATAMSAGSIQLGCVCCVADREDLQRALANKAALLAEANKKPYMRLR